MNKYGFKKLKAEAVTELKSEEKKQEPNKKKVKHLNRRINYLAKQIRAWIPKKKGK